LAVEFGGPKFTRFRTACGDGVARRRVNRHEAIGSVVVGAFNAAGRQQARLNCSQVKYHYCHNFKLILVDECQDMSQERAKLIKALLNKSPDANLFAVGDDWQSIYRFTGSDIDVFTRFANHFGVAATNYLAQTFRSNQGISDIAAAFVQKNPSQMTKRVKAHDSASDGAVVVRQYTTLEEMDRVCRGSLEEIAKLAGSGKRISVFLLARYRLQRPQALEEWQRQFPMFDITCRTVHSSKGLEADYVIVLRLHTGSYAFPSEISDDPLLQLVMPQAESFPNAEERRLFSVAMTLSWLQKGGSAARQVRPGTFPTHPSSSDS
jgi:DNA helicase IV